MADPQKSQALKLALAGGGGALLVLGLVALNPGGVFRGQAPAPAVSVSVEAALPAPEASVAPAPSASVPNMRAKIREAIEASPVSSAAQLDRYLDGLVEQARKKGAVTALEVEPGLAMIMKFSEDPEKHAAFSRRMVDLQSELSGRKPEPPPDPKTLADKIVTLTDSIKKTEGEQKQVLIKEYLAAAQQLPEDQMNDAMAKLNAIAGQHTPPPDSAAADALWSGIESAKDEETRQDLIREYLNYIHGLPPEEEQERLAKLNKQYGRREEGIPKR
jgi:hypothetical protein